MRKYNYFPYNDFKANRAIESEHHFLESTKKITEIQEQKTKDILAKCWQDNKNSINDIIYVLINEAMPGYVKIGKANNLEQRMRSLDNTSVPLPFECFYACRVNNADFVEKTLREIFSDRRVRSNREFFDLSPDRVLSALKLVESREDVTPNCDFVESEEDQKALNQARKRRSAFNFEMVDIPVGSEIQYVHDENIKAKVVDNRKIELNGEVTSLSTEAKKLLNSPNNVQGTLYWKYDGETLDARRSRFEEKEKQCLEVEEQIGTKMLKKYSSIS